MPWEALRPGGPDQTAGTERRDVSVWLEPSGLAQPVDFRLESLLRLLATRRQLGEPRHFRLKPVTGRFQICSLPGWAFCVAGSKFLTLA
jgi:hypothetical protein